MPDSASHLDQSGSFLLVLQGCIMAALHPIMGRINRGSEDLAVTWRCTHVGEANTLE